MCFYIFDEIGYFHQTLMKLGGFVRKSSCAVRLLTTQLHFSWNNIFLLELWVFRIGYLVDIFSERRELRLSLQRKRLTVIKFELSSKD